MAPRIPRSLAGPADPRTQSAQDPGRPVWCNLPIVTLIAHSASWSRTLAALRPAPGPSNPPFQPLVVSSFALGRRCTFIRSIPSAALSFSFASLFDVFSPGDFLSSTTSFRSDNSATRRPPAHPRSSHHCDPAGGPPRPTSDPDARTVMTRERELPTLRR